MCRPYRSISIRRYPFHLSIRERLLQIVIGVGVSLIIYRLLVGRATLTPWLPLIVMPVILIGYHLWRGLPPILRATYVGCLIGVVLSFGVQTIRLVAVNATSPPEFDVKVFWVFGSAAQRGLNFYDPQELRTVAELLEPSAQMIAELFYMYPPQTILLFAPLGWFDVNTGILLWYIVQLVILLVDISLLWYLFQKNNGWLGWLWTAAMTLMLHPISSTLGFGQTNLIVLLLLLLFWYHRERSRAGIWLALAIIVKPFMAVILLFLILRRYLRILGMVTVTLGIITIMALIYQGWQNFLHFFTANAEYNAINYYTLNTATSLTGLIARQNHNSLTNAALLAHPVFLVVAALMILVSGGFILRLKGQDAALWGLLLTLPLGLILYPSTGGHYATVLIIPFMLMWINRQLFIGYTWGVIVLLTSVYCLFGYVFQGGEHVVIGFVLTWLALLFVCWRCIAQQQAETLTPIPQNSLSL